MCEEHSQVALLSRGLQDTSVTQAYCYVLDLPIGLLMILFMNMYKLYKV